MTRAVANAFATALVVSCESYLKGTREATVTRTTTA